MTTKCWLNPVSLLRSICIWWLEENIFSRQKLNPVSLLRSICIWWLVKLITSQFYKKDNFSWRRIRTLNPASASGDLLNWSLHNSTKETISHDEKMSTKSSVFDKRQLIRIGMDSVLMYVILNYVSLRIDTTRVWSDKKISTLPWRMKAAERNQRNNLRANMCTM